MSNLTSNTTPQVIISFSEDLVNQADFATIEKFYTDEKLIKIFSQVLSYLATHPKIEIPSPTAQTLGDQLFNKPCEIELYITEPVEAQAINLDARGKDYATNILSYPSELPPSVIEILPSLPLGELVICHDVVTKQANEQGKTLENHLTHLLVHGLLHLLEFDHELGKDEQDEMERIEIAVLEQSGVANPYEA